MKPGHLLIALSCVTSLALGACAKSENAFSEPPQVKVAELPPHSVDNAQGKVGRPVVMIDGPKGARQYVEHPLDKVRIGPGDFGDAITTGYGIWSGLATEGNPIFSPFGDAVPIIVIPAKYGLKKLAVKAGSTPAQANVGVESFGALGTCSNIAVLSGASIAPALGLGVICAIAYRVKMRKSYEAATGRTLSGVELD